MELKHDHLTRQLDIIPLETLGQQVTIIGCGAIGSFLGLQQRRERIYIIAYPNGKFSERQPAKSVFREPYLPWELPRVYPGWRERWDLPEPRTFRSTNEFPDLVDRNKCVGNAVQPLMAQYLFECIKCFDQ